MTAAHQAQAAKTGYNTIQQAMSPLNDSIISGKEGTARNTNNMFSPLGTQRDQPFGFVDVQKPHIPDAMDRIKEANRKKRQADRDRKTR